MPTWKHDDAATIIILCVISSFPNSFVSLQVLYSRIIFSTPIFMPNEQSQIKERQNVNLREPRRYKVIIHNDDVTTMEFVVMVLKVVFFMNDEKANTLMMQVHRSEQAVVGVYTYDIAMSKAQKATNMARENGYPLRITVEQEEN